MSPCWRPRAQPVLAGTGEGAACFAHLDRSASSATLESMLAASWRSCCQASLWAAASCLRRPCRACPSQACVLCSRSQRRSARRGQAAAPPSAAGGQAGRGWDAAQVRSTAVGGGPTCMRGQSTSPSMAPQVRTSQLAASHRAVEHSAEASSRMKPAWKASALASNSSSWRACCARRSSYAAVLGAGVEDCTSQPLSSRERLYPQPPAQLCARLAAGGDQSLTAAGASRVGKACLELGDCGSLVDLPGALQPAPAGHVPACTHQWCRAGHGEPPALPCSPDVRLRRPPGRQHRACALQALSTPGGA